MSTKKRTLESYIDEFYKKFPDKDYIKFIKKDKAHFIVEDKYGLCRVARSHLMGGWMPSIRVAINKNDYITKRIHSIHGNYYDCSKIDYTGLDNPIKLICPIHGEFEITPHSITSQKAGCSKCGYNKTSIKNGESALGWSDTDWYKKALNSKSFDSFKVYIIKCWKDEEEFYKIGKTFRILKERFSKEKMPYKYTAIKIFEFKDLTLESSKKASILERMLKDNNKYNEYLPLLEMRGKFECFKQINII